MAFNPETRKLLAEIEESERNRNECLLGVNRAIREYVGRWYRGGRESYTASAPGEEGANPEPFAYSFVSNILPALLYDVPALKVEARRVMGHKIFAEAMQSGLTGLLRDIPFKKELEAVVVDFLFFHGVAMHILEDDERWSSGAVRPNVKRIDPKTWFVDSLATCYEAAEFAGHWYWVDMDDLLADPALDAAAREKLRPSSGGMQAGPAGDPFRRSEPERLNRRRVKVYSIWMRRANTLRVMVNEPAAIELYPERPYYGPKTGPYTLFGAYPVPGQVYPLAPLVAVEDQVIDLQVHARAASRSAAGRKSVILVDGTVANLAEDIHNAEDREVISIPGFNSSQAQQLEFGGVTPQQYEWLDNRREILREHSGMTQVIRGSTSGSTATESQIASDALNNRLDYLKSKVRDGVKDVLKSLGWFLFHTPGVMIPVNRTDPLTGMQTEGLFFGGQYPGEDSGQWEDYNLSVEPYSMQRVSEQMLQRRAMDLYSLITESAQLMPSIPWIRWQPLLRMVGEAMNHPEVEDYLDIAMLGGVASGELIPPGTLMGPGEGQPDRYSTPGQGFKPRPGGEMSNASPAVDEMRSEFSKPFGDEYGGTQGPPGSRRM